MRWEDVVALAADLPGVEAGTSCGRPALKVRGKAIAVEDRTPDHVVLTAGLDEIEVLLAIEPAVFFQTDHYRGWPAVLARHGTADKARVRVLAERAWERRASRAQRAARGDTSRPTS